MFEVQFLWNGWSGKDRVNSNLIQQDWPDLDILIDFAFSPYLSMDIANCLFSILSILT